MHLKIENICKVSTADIEIAGITVIAGENNTGKSTVGKVLWSIFNSYSDLKSHISQQKNDSINRMLESLVFSIPKGFRFRDDDYADIMRSITELPSTTTKDSNELRGLIERYVSLRCEDIDWDKSESDVSRIQARIAEMLQVTDEEISKIVVSNMLNSEFNGQVNRLNSDSPGRAELTIKGNTSTIIVENDAVSDINTLLHLTEKPVYIDDPFVLDDLSSFYAFPQRYYANHRSFLRGLLSGPLQSDEVISGIIAEKKLDRAYGLLNEACSGRIQWNKRARYVYYDPVADINLDVRNLSTGMKAFALIKMLLLNGSIKENGTVILDEPEIHLHPKWQVLFAELIAILQKEFGLHILLTTHSPYFLRAIEVYSRKYGLESECRYYLAELGDQAAIIRDVTDDTASIYKTLAYPFQVLEEVRYEY